MSAARPNRPKPSRLTARQAAHAALLDVLSGTGFAADRIRRFRRSEQLDARDTGLAMQISLGAIRHIVCIDGVLAALATYHPQRVSDELRAVLLSAAFQLIWLDRVPPFAAVDEAVELARRLQGPRAAGMVNAVLRRVSGAIVERGAAWRRDDAAQVRTGWATACTFSRAVLPPARDRIAHLAASCGERVDRIADLVERFGADSAQQVAWAAQAEPPLVLHRNALRADAATFAEKLARATGGEAEIDGDTAFVRASGSTESDLFSGCELWAQDTTQRSAADAIGARPGELVLDLCSAPGGKAIAMAQRMGDVGRIVACDVDADRLAAVRSAAQRLEIRCIETRRIAGDDAMAGELGSAFDAAIVDVPCSNTGSIARRPEVRLRFRRSELPVLAQTQRRLLEAAAACVRAGGRLVYSTCSIEPEENERVVAEFARQRPEWTVVTERLTLPRWGARARDWRDGGYFALLDRRGPA